MNTHNRREETDQIALLRSRRIKPEADHTMAAQIEAAQAAVKKSRRQMAGARKAFDAATPAELRGDLSIGGLHGGTLTLFALTAGVKFMADRWLRAGGEKAIQRASMAAIKRVVLKQGTPVDLIPTTDRPPVPEMPFEEAIELDEQIPTDEAEMN